jgi:hypothetical protein
VETVADSAKEPSIVEGPDGTLFVTGFGKLADGQPQQVPRLWKSTASRAATTRLNLMAHGRFARYSPKWITSGLAVIRPKLAKS